MNGPNAIATCVSCEIISTSTVEVACQRRESDGNVDRGGRNVPALASNYICLSD